MQKITIKHILLNALTLYIMFYNSLNGHSVVFSNSNRTEPTYWHGDKNKKKIALTFDDGPNEPYTSSILDILKEHNIKATFFVIGKHVEYYPETAKRIVKEGHTIGNHTYTHPDLILKMGIFKMRNEIKKAEEVIESVAGVKPFLFRPPHGSGGYIEARNMGYSIIKWSVSAHNGNVEMESEKIIKNILMDTKNGSIILIHDGKRLEHGADRSQTVKALPVIIESLKDKGYQFVTVPELLCLKKI